MAPPKARARPNRPIGFALIRSPTGVLYAKYGAMVWRSARGRVYGVAVGLTWNRLSGDEYLLGIVTVPLRVAARYSRSSE